VIARVDVLADRIVLTSGARRATFGRVLPPERLAVAVCERIGCWASAGPGWTVERVIVRAKRPGGRAEVRRLISRGSPHATVTGSNRHAHHRHLLAAQQIVDALAAETSFTAICERARR